MGNPKEKVNDADAANQAPVSSQEQDKLDAVRDLLFGQNVKEYREEIQELKEHVKQNRSEIDKSIEGTNVEVLKKLEELSDQFEKRSGQIEEKLEELLKSKVDKSSLAGLLKDIATQLESD
ncbi:MAG: hypothetical protein ABJG78_12125 [Cyclobacteriaceae bacterium]